MEANSGQIRDEEDGRKLSGLFPDEIWLMIFDLTENPSDLITWSLASSFWKNLLGPTRQRFMFPKVVEILVARKFLELNDCNSLLQMRLVCTMWKYGVDRVLETRSHYKNLAFDRYGLDVVHCDICYPIYFRPNAAHIIDKLDTQITPTLISPFHQNHNPFPSRCVEISENDWRNEPEPGPDHDVVTASRYNTERFLQVAGHHFWYAHIYSGVGLVTCDWYTLLCKYIRHLPNLRSLHIKCLCCDRRQYLRSNLCSTFPTLKHLELLSIEQAPCTVINGITHVNSHVQVLLLPLHLPCSDSRWLPPDHPRQQLELSHVHNPKIVSCLLPGLREFLRFPNDWRLQTLRIGLVHNSSVILPKVFQKLQEYKATLAELYIEFPRAYTLDEKVNILGTSRGELDLPNLNCFEAAIKNYCSLDFLLGMQSLELLSIRFRPSITSAPEGDPGTDVINFNYGFSDRVMQCNIWELIPSLTTFRLNSVTRTEIYRRAARQVTN